MEQTSMDEVALAAGMSKSTLYVYFRSKDEIKNHIALEAMTYFYKKLNADIAGKQGNSKELYMRLCYLLVEFKKEYPLSFDCVVQNISVDEADMIKNPVLKDIFDIGEKINSILIDLFGTGSNLGGKELISKIFVQWGSIYGLIMLADNKEEYIRQRMGITKEEFLQNGFEQLYKLICNDFCQ